MCPVGHMVVILSSQGAAPHDPTAGAGKAAETVIVGAMKSKPTLTLEDVRAAAAAAEAEALKQGREERRAVEQKLRPPTVDPRLRFRG